MDLQLLVGLSLTAALAAVAVSVICLIRIEDLHREWAPGRNLGRNRHGSLRGRGKLLHLPGSSPPRR